MEDRLLFIFSKNIFDGLTVMISACHSSLLHSVKADKARETGVRLPVREFTEQSELMLKIKLFVRSFCGVCRLNGGYVRGANG